MREFQRKQKVRHAIYSLPTLIILAIVALLLVRGAIRVVGKERESHSRVNDLVNTVSTMESREGELKESINYLKTEAGIRDEIRDRFNVTQEDEYVAIIIDEKESATSIDDDQIPWYKRFWRAIMGDNEK